MSNLNNLKSFDTKNFSYFKGFNDYLISNTNYSSKSFEHLKLSNSGGIENIETNSHFSLNINDDFESDFEKYDYNKIKIPKIKKNTKFEFFKNYNKETINNLNFKKLYQIEKEKLKNVYKCDICDAVFNKPSSLGGHTSKKHKGKSKQYETKQIINKIRSQERKRKEFINNKI